MKIQILLAPAAGVFLAACSGTQVIAAETSTSLFNGTSLEGWSHVLVGEGVKKEDVWSVKDGILGRV